MGTTAFVQRVTEVTLRAPPVPFCLCSLREAPFTSIRVFTLLRTLALRSLVLLNGEIDHMIVRFNTEDLFRQFNRPTGLFAFVFMISSCMIVNYCSLLNRFGWRDYFGSSRWNRYGPEWIR